MGGHSALRLGQLTAECGQEPFLISVLTSLDCSKGVTGAAPGEAAAGQEVVWVDARCRRGCPRGDLEQGPRPESAPAAAPAAPGNSALCSTELRCLFCPEAHPSPPADHALCPDHAPAACTWSRGRIPVEPCLSAACISISAGPGVGFVGPATSCTAAHPAAQTGCLPSVSAPPAPPSRILCVFGASNKPPSP